VGHGETRPFHGSRRPVTPSPFPRGRRRTCGNTRWKYRLPGTVPTIKAAGGKYLAGGFNNATALSGAPPANRLVLIQFENVDKAKAWYDAGQREREKTEGSKVASSFRILAIEGVQ
jgi:uncharacterized protein (DUF1330 family)